MVNSPYGPRENPVTRTPPPRIILRATARDHLLDLLFFLYGGPALPESSHPAAKQEIRDFATTAPNLRQIVALTSTPGREQLISIAHRAPQIAPMMDNFLQSHGVLWNGRDKYAFNPGQWAVWQVVPEEINAIRRYSVSPRLRTERLLSGLLRLLRRFG